jgi:hypothetical protein
LREESLETSQEISALLDEVKALKVTIEWEKPLVEIGAAIRLRFWEQIFSNIDERQASTELVEAGDTAVQRGNWTADLALFRLGHNPRAWSTAAHQFSKKFSNRMMQFSADDQFAESVYLDAPRVLEHVDLLTAFLNCHSTHSRDKSHPNYQEIVKIINRLDQQYFTLGRTAFETDLGVGKDLLKLKQLIQQFVCPNPSRKRARNE